LQSTEFDIEKEYVSRVVGAHGAGINKLRDQLGVKVDVSDDVDERERESNKKKKAVHQKSRVKVFLSSEYSFACSYFY
jgi:predicted PilT family ATPase